MKKLIYICLFFLLLTPYAAKADVSLVGLIKKVRPAVVLIQTFDKDNKPLMKGSGFFVNKEGHIITNFHVIENAYWATVRTMAGRNYFVEGMIAKDEKADLVMLFVDVWGSDVTALELTNKLPSVGEDIVVVGNPLGLESTVSNGIISAVREIPAFGHILQITAPISLGSSGSPVLNMKGQVIGIATIILTEGQALNFAVPSEKILALKREEKVIRLSEYADAVIGGERDEAEKLYEVGWKRVLAGEWTEALDYFERTIREKPDHEGAYFGLGFVYSILERNEEAVQAYKQAITINPDDADTYYFLGEAYSNSGRYEEAVQAYKLAIAINPDDADTHYSLGLVYYVMGDTVSALGEYLILMDLDEEIAVQLSNIIYEKETLLPSEDVDTKEPYSYHNSQGHFSLTIPAGWEEISEDAINEYYKAIQESAVQKLSLKLEYKAAFQKTSSTYFTHPYILFTIDNRGQVPQSELQEFLSYDRWEEALDRGAQAVENALPNLIQNSEIGQTQYDKDKKIIFFKTEFDAVGVGNVLALNAMFLSNYGSVNLHCYSTKENFEDDLLYFTQIIDSFKFDVGYRYDQITKDNYPVRNNSSKSLRNIGFAVFVCGVLATIIIIVIAKRSADRLESIESVAGKNMIESLPEAGPGERPKQEKQIGSVKDVSLTKTGSEHDEFLTEKIKICANCEREIGKLEKTFLFNGNIVCFECYERLK